MTQWWIGAFVVMLAAAFGYYIRLIIGRYAVKSSEQDSSRMLSDARREAESIRQGAGLQAKEAVLKAREEFEANIKTRRQEIAALEERAAQRELDGLLRRYRGWCGYRQKQIYDDRTCDRLSSRYEPELGEPRTNERPPRALPRLQLPDW